VGGIVERAILVIVLMVALVGVVGLFTSYDFSAADALQGGMTGNVVATPASYDCTACAGYAPVCAKRNHLYKTYTNACEAVCDNAEIAIEKPCLAVRKN
jgi:hypothetical protein